LIFGERHGVVGQVFWSLLISKKRMKKMEMGKKTPPTDNSNINSNENRME